MATTTYPSIATNYTAKTAAPSLFTRFINWCEGQQPNRLLWLGVALASHGCILTPITVLAVLLAGANFFLFMLAMVAMGIALITNLAALPTKYTIPAFVLSIVIDVVIVIATISIGFDITKTYI